MAVLLMLPVILQTAINVIMLSIGGQGENFFGIFSKTNYLYRKSVINRHKGFTYVCICLLFVAWRSRVRTVSSCGNLVVTRRSFIPWHQRLNLAQLCRCCISLTSLTVTSGSCDLPWTMHRRSVYVCLC